MLSYNSAKELVDRLDHLSKILASTQNITIYHGFKGGERIPFEEAKEQLALISKTGAEIKEELMQYQDQEVGSSIISLCITYANRLLENTKILGDITEKLKQFSDGGERYGFFKFWSDTKEWKRNTKKLINVRSNVELFMRNTAPW